MHLLEEPTHMQLKIPEKDAATEKIVEKKIFNKNQQIFHVWDNLATRQQKFKHKDICATLILHTFSCLHRLTM